MDNNYVVAHLHSTQGNLTFFDSTVDYKKYIDRAVEYNMKAIAFTEHGNILGHVFKKKYANEHGLKYIHAEEFYVTERIGDKLRDNYHCCLYAKNWDGVKELNKLSSTSFYENHYYYVPRISFQELISTSKNIIITTACVGGILGGKAPKYLENDFINFLAENRERCYLEVQPHNNDTQKAYNKKLLLLSQIYNIPLIAATDTHYLDNNNLREIGQKGKKCFYETNEEMDLSFRNYETLVADFAKQGVLEEETYLMAIRNTNALADAVVDYEFDFSFKYPRYPKAKEFIVQKIKEGLKEKHLKYEDYKQIIQNELDVFEHNDALDFLILDYNNKQECIKNNIHFGCGRGSAASSFIGYLMGLTSVNPIQYKLWFPRFMSTSRVSLADIDTDFASTDKEKVKGFLFNNEKLNCCNILTFQTVQLKGAIQLCGRALGFPAFEMIELSKSIDNDNEDGLLSLPKSKQKKYSEVFDLAIQMVKSGAIVSKGVHASGVVCADIDIEEMFGTLRDKKVQGVISQITMKELDFLNYVKLDILGLSTLDLIDRTCINANIPFIDYDKIDYDDDEVWDSLIEDTQTIFQYNKPYTQHIINLLLTKDKFNSVAKYCPNMTRFDLFTTITGIIRPCGDSYRDEFLQNKIHDNHHPAINKFLEDTRGYLIYQEQIMQFVMKFAGYSMAESDVLRKKIGKKLGTEEVIPEFEARFIDYMTSNYGGNYNYKEIVKPISQIIIDSGNYSFNKAHAYSYAKLSYICAYLRHYYLLEYVTAGLNVFSKGTDPYNRFLDYAAYRGISQKSITFRKSREKTFMDKETQSIYKGLNSVKSLNKSVYEDIAPLYDKKFDNISDLLCAVCSAIGEANTKVLIKLNYFSNVANINYLLQLFQILDNFKFGKAKMFSKERVKEPYLEKIIKANSQETNKTYKIENCMEIIYSLEKRLNSLNIKELSTNILLGWQFEYLNDISPTNKKEDNTKMFILEKKPLIANKTKRLFAYKIITQSIGTGKKTESKIYTRDYKFLPDFEEGDIIKVTRADSEMYRDTQQLVLRSYILL